MHRALLRALVALAVNSLPPRSVQAELVFQCKGAKIAILLTAALCLLRRPCGLGQTPDPTRDA